MSITEAERAQWLAEEGITPSSPERRADATLVAERCCPWTEGYTALSAAQYAHAWGLADGFGRASATYARAHGFYGDWSHFRDATDAALHAVATYLRTLPR